MTGRCELAIVYDSDGLRGYETGWGFSVLISMDGDRTLFDCGWDGHILRRNLGRLGVSFADIHRVVLSHSHWDHLSGLTNVLDDPVVAGRIQVFVPTSFSRNLKNEISRRASLVEVNGPREISQGILTTGPLGSDPEEQSLIISAGGRSVVLTGCAHPGVAAIMAKAGELSDPAWLMGGLHGAEASDIPEDIEGLVLCHCTKNRSAIAAAFGERAATGSVGEVYQLTDSQFEKV